MKKKTYILIDGGAIRHFLRAQRLHYQGEKGAANYEKIALHATRGNEEDLQKILYLTMPGVTKALDLADQRQ